MECTSQLSSLLYGLIHDLQTVQQLCVVVAANGVASDEVSVQLIQLHVRLLHAPPVVYNEAQTSLMYYSGTPL